MKQLVILLVFCVYHVISYSQINIQAITETAQKGDIYAQKFLGDAYSKGIYRTEINLQEAYNWYLAAAKQGDAEAQYEVAMFEPNFYGDWQSQESFDKAIAWLRMSADNGYAPAQKVAGDLLFGKKGEEVKVFDYFYKAAQQSYPPAYFGLANCHLQGIGTIVNLSKAKHWFKLAVSEAGRKDAYIKLVVCAMIEKDYADAKNYAQKGIEADLPDAYYSMAWIYAEGNGVNQDFGEAHRLIDVYISKEPKSSNGAESKGLFYLMEGKMDEAQELWNKIVEVDPSITERRSSFALAMMNSIDNNIPESSLKSEKTFALVIANEDYKRVSPVSFAKNDGNVFAEYCKKTLGVPEKNVYLVEDATLGDIKYHINLIKKIADAFNGEARVIFYYAGHGIPDEAQKTSYLLPVDGYGNDATSGYSLESLYTELASIPAKSTLVFMDACFSGAQRDGSMMTAARGVAIKPKEEVPTGKLIVFSAAQGDETAYPYTEKRHGMFTYFLLKKLQETKGDVSLSELGNYIVDNVSKESVVSNGKSQTPTVTASPSVADTWQNMKLR